MHVSTTNELFSLDSSYTQKHSQKNYITTIPAVIPEYGYFLGQNM